MKLHVLRQKPEYIAYIADVYMKEWAWHYEDDWGISTYDEMIDDIKDHYLDDIYLVFDDEGPQLIGTYAILDADLKSHMHIGPWLSCLYVVPERRQRGHGTAMIERATRDHPGLFLWCYTQKERDLYTRSGFRLYETIVYDSKDAWILQKT